MKKLCRIFSMVGVLLMLLCGAAMAESQLIALPADLTEIREEAFLNNTSLNKVNLPEGVLSIGPRAFAGSSAKEITLPRSLESIADNAFDNCASLHLYVWRDTYAHEWCALRSIPYTVLDMTHENQTHAVHSVEPHTAATDVTTFHAIVSTVEECTLQVSIFTDDEDEKLLHTFTADAAACLNQKEIIVPATAELPQWYVLRAVLVDANGDALCPPYSTRHYTQAYHQFESQTPEDFQESRVLDFGTSGYAVLAENVIRTYAEGTAVSEGFYRLASAPALNAGDIIHFTVDGQSMVMKLSSVTPNSDGSATVLQDEDVTLSEMYDVVHIDAYATDPTQSRKYDPIDDIYTLFDETMSLSIGKDPVGAELSGNLALRLRIRFDYHKNLLGKDYFELETYAETFGTIGVFFGAEIDTWKSHNAPTIPLYNGPATIPGIAIPVHLEVSIPFNVKAQVGGDTSFSFLNKTGFSYNPLDGFQKIAFRDADAYAGLKGGFEVSFGPEVSISESLFGSVEARIGGQAGLRVKGVLETPQYGGTTEPTGDSIHACLACIDMDIVLFGEVKATLTYEIGDWVSGKLLDLKVLSGELDLGDLYASIINEKESIFGGEMEVGRGACPNLKYRTNLYTYDMHGNEVKGLLTTITGSKVNALQGLSPTRAYLYPGEYNADAVINGNTWVKGFTITDEPASVIIQEIETTVVGTVTSSRDSKPIPNAMVTIILPDGTQRQTTTDSNGEYSFFKLPGGTYGFVFEAEKHETRTTNNLNFMPGSRQKFDVELNATGPLPLITAFMNQSGTVQALTEDGTCPEGVPEIKLTGTFNKQGLLKTVRINHEDCGTVLVHTPTFESMQFSFFGVDLGGGEYVFVVTNPNSGRGGGADILVFRLVNGQWDILENFASDVGFDGRFTSNTEFSGTLYPSMIPVNGSAPNSSTYVNRTNLAIWNRGWGSLGYEKLPDETYVLRYTLQQCCLGIYDTFGEVAARYAYKDGEIAISELWFESYLGTVFPGAPQTH